MPASQYYSIAESADRLGVCTKTVRRFIASGKLPAFRAGPRLVRIRAEDVEAILRPIPTGGARG